MLMNSGIYTGSLPRKVLPRVSFESLCQLSVLAIDRRSVEKIAAEIKCTLWKIVKIFNELMVKKGDFACIAD